MAYEHDTGGCAYSIGL